MKFIELIKSAICKDSKSYKSNYIYLPGENSRYIDRKPWQHPSLTENNIGRFRKYSMAVWEFALDYQSKHTRPLKIAFSVNMAQNMYKWARMAQTRGFESALFLHSWDTSAINQPGWEDFDGESSDVMDKSVLGQQSSQNKPNVPCYTIPMERTEFFQLCKEFYAGNRLPFLRLLSKTPTIRHETLSEFRFGIDVYYDWAKALSGFDAIYSASVPIAAYCSGRPYCVFSVGADLEYDCGMADVKGLMMSLAFNSARFSMISNPHTYGQCRRHGFTNGIWLPYPMDDSRYCPGEGAFRKIWEERYGKGVYVLATSRIDKKVKGQDDTYFKTVIDVAKKCPQIRFIFLAWGESAQEFKEQVISSGMTKQLIVLPPVGKKRLIDYLRSADIILDQMVLGYYGTTALEAAAISKPVIMKLRLKDYMPLYDGDVAPVWNVKDHGDIREALLSLSDSPELRKQQGTAMRNWLVRNHGEDKTMPLLMALLRITADQVALPEDLKNPLEDEETDEERAYRFACKESISG
jgi:glycosyltransferase involved in cell wall biosynthesis